MNHLTKLFATLGLLAVHVSAAAQFSPLYSTTEELPGGSAFQRLGNEQANTQSGFEFLDDIDGDNRADTVSLLRDTNGQLASWDCDYLVIGQSSALSDGQVVPSDLVDHILIYNGRRQSNAQFCASMTSYAQLGDVNGDGTRDVAIVAESSNGSTIHIVFLPDAGASINLLDTNGNNGFMITRTEPSSSIVVRPMGDLNGDGLDDIMVDGKVFAGAASYSPIWVDYDNPESVSVLIDKRVGGGTIQAAGDVNGDGFDDTLIGSLNSVNHFVLQYGSATLSSIVDINTSGGAGPLFLRGCSNRFSCRVRPIGDFDGDGFDDLAFSAFGSECGYASTAGILYGSASGIDQNETFSDFPANSITWLSEIVGSGCLNGRMLGGVGDLNGDGSADLAITSLSQTSIVLGTQGKRADFILVEELDGSNGFGIAPALTSGDNQTSGRTVLTNRTGIDINGDNFDDLILTPWTTSEVTNLVAADRFVLSGTANEQNLPTLNYLVVEYSPTTWLIRWGSPVVDSATGSAAQVDSYRIVLDGVEIASVDGSTGDIQLQHTDPGIVRIDALDSTGAVIATRVRQVPEYDFNNQLDVTVHGDQLLEISFNREGRYLDRTMQYQIWRNGAPLTLTGDNVDSYWDNTVAPGTTYTYYLTPFYSLQSEVSTAEALRSRPALQFRSNSITVTTPGQAIAAVDNNNNENSNSNTGDTVSAENSIDQTLTIGTDTITWTGSGWFEVQRTTDYQTICQGGNSCTVEPGEYNVINHSSGQRFENIQVPAESSQTQSPSAPPLEGSSDNSQNDPVAFQLQGNNIIFNPQGNNFWFEVQDAASYQTLCEGNVSCEVVPGTYTVINHNTGDRFEQVVINNNEAGAGVSITVEANLIRWPDDGWYQVQRADTFTTVCEGGRSCVVEPGVYIVINHTTQQRLENVSVPN